jgi:UDP-N-acetylmuramoyl-tripeptide--D-alanyl-D-alanine ligase
MELVKKIVVSVLNWATVRYVRRNHITVIAVAGSIGKTSTTNAIRTVLSERYKVHQPKTTYNTNRSIHLEMFDMNFVSNPLAWGWTVLRVLVKTCFKAKYQVHVVEIGTDYPGELQGFAFLKPQIGVLTAISPEHMEQFKNLDAVAAEELVMAEFCDKLIFNANTVPKKYVPEKFADRITWYGSGAEYDAVNYRMQTETKADGPSMTMHASFMAMNRPLGNLQLQVLGEHSLAALVAAMVVGLQCDLDRRELERGLQAVRPVKGRMQPMRGTANSIIIDDSYNASPDATKAALDVLYQFDTPQRIAVLGSMNEMGDYSPAAHRQVGDYCDPVQLALVVTIGEDANTYLAKQAEDHGCKVERFTSPYAAGEFVRTQLQSGAVLLFKGSQNGVFTEEAIKSVLASPKDVEQLVRQSEYWLKQKAGQFPDNTQKA